MTSHALVEQTPEISRDCACRDDFAENCAAGRVIGTRCVTGQHRLGVDAEKVLSIDNGALRIAPLIEAGFGRAVLAYGPFRNAPGLAYSVRLLNGHNTAQAESLPGSWRHRLVSWLRGSETEPIPQRVLRWIRSGQVRRTLRQFRWWKRVARGGRPVPRLDENLAVGLFPRAVVADPRLEGDAFIMHALGPENGELWAGPSTARTRALRGVQNLPLYLVAVLRNPGVVYYVASVAGSTAGAEYPRFRPIAIGPAPSSGEVYLGIQQSVLGQIGFRVDSRILGVRVGYIEGYESWRGGAVAADRLGRRGAIHHTHAEIGGRWRVVGVRARENADDASNGEGPAIAILDPGLPAGLVHAVARVWDAPQAPVGLVVRFRDEWNHWRLELDGETCRMLLVENGEEQIVASRAVAGSTRTPARRLQILDDGSRLMGYIDGEPLADTGIGDERFAAETRCGIVLADRARGDSLQSFEAHPRSIRLPSALDQGPPWLRLGSEVMVADDFAGDSAPLEGRIAPVGGKRWTRVIGSGEIRLTGSGSAAVRATPDRPCPGRTAYCVDWTNPRFADLGIRLTPPGTAKGQRHKCTAGFILYQDPDNFVILNVWLGDWYPAASISTFFRFGGYEDVYDAVWSNIGKRVTHGRAAHLRLSSDGEQYVAFVDDEPVLYRAFRDVYADVRALAIRKVGIVANWEFGNDTGSRFHRFEARR